MTQKEIVTVLRCCAEGECHDCTIHNDKQRCQERVLAAAADLIEAQQTKIDQLMADLMASVAGKLGGTFTPAEAFKLIEYYKGEKCVMCKHFGGVKGKHLAEDLPEDHGENCWKIHCNFEWVPPEKRVE